ncbi:MAG: alanine--tRNA ligase, partial [Methanoregulaceae archaeon]|nr:alanine--tRNA ligase [Methanoregulaceae archaeon]
LAYLLEDNDFTKILSLNAKFAGLMDISGTNLFQLRSKVAQAIDVPIEKLDRMITPIEKVYAIVDHTRCLAYMLGDCIVPSNVREGYLARLVLRRTLRMMNDLGVKEGIGNLIEEQMRIIGNRTFEQDPVIIRSIVDREVEKYGSTLTRGTKIVQKIARSYKSKTQRVPLKEVITLYDSHGIPPEMTREIAMKEGAVVDLPDNFYSLIADMHSASGTVEAADPYVKYQARIKGLPATRRLYYEQPCATEFEGMVIDSFDGYVVMDQTLFYPEGGGQPADTGMLITAESMVRVEEVAKIGEVILHQVSGGVLKRGDRIKGIIDEERRWSLMRHHTATHLLLRASKEVLGAHIHQAGAQKGPESSRIDIRHYTHITPDELHRIEIAANRMVMADCPVAVTHMDRVAAEQEHGFSLYQGGVPPGRNLRIVSVAGDVEACAGTHCESTGEIGTIKIIRVEHIQDGIERIEFSAGLAAIEYIHRLDRMVSDSAGVLSVQPENMTATVTRFFSEWKDRGKEIERLSERLVALEIAQIQPESIGGVPVVVKRIDLPPGDLSTIAHHVSSNGGVALIAGGIDRANVVISSGNDAVNAGEIIGQICTLLGGKGGGGKATARGGGPDLNQLDLALKVGRERITAAING